MSHRLCPSKLRPLLASPSVTDQVTSDDTTQDWASTALIISAEYGHEQVARVLLEAGADQAKEVPGHAGWNALKVAEM